MGVLMYAICALVEKRMTRWAFRGEIGGQAPALGQPETRLDRHFEPGQGSESPTTSRAPDRFHGHKNGLSGDVGEPLRYL
jgi:hypothetical protein